MCRAAPGYVRSANELPKDAAKLLASTRFPILEKYGLISKVSLTVKWTEDWEIHIFIFKSISVHPNYHLVF